MPRITARNIDISMIFAINKLINTTEKKSLQYKTIFFNSTPTFTVIFQVKRMIILTLISKLIGIILQGVLKG